MAKGDPVAWGATECALLMATLERMRKQSVLLTSASLVADMESFIRSNKNDFAADDLVLLEKTVAKLRKESAAVLMALAGGNATFRRDAEDAFEIEPTQQ